MYNYFINNAAAEINKMAYTHKLNKMTYTTVKAVTDGALFLVKETGERKELSNNQIQFLLIKTN